MKDNKISQAGELSSTPLQFQTNPPHRILMVEDDISVSLLNNEILTRSGYEVDAAKDGAAAWDALNVDSYDLMITDNSMPRMTGLELLKKLRAARMEMPVIMATGVLPTLGIHPQPLASTRRYAGQTLYRRGVVKNGEKSPARSAKHRRRAEELPPGMTRAVSPTAPLKQGRQ
jgi:chemotaxis response regulator CheB